MSILSVIVPIYNVETYLEKCINSIINQTYSDLEIILIDDGSTDNSLSICKKYIEIDSRIILIHQKNLGVSVARNKGIDIAKGEWITFVDSDDYLAANAYESLICQAEENNCDVAIMDFAYVDKDGVIVKKREYPYGDTVILNKEEVIRHQFDIPLSIRLVMWNKVFKREVIKNLRYDETLRASEDTLMLYQCLQNTNKAIWIKKPLYFNVQRPGSAMRGGLKVKDYALSLDVHREILLNIKAQYPQMYDYALVFYIDTCVWKMNSQLPIPSDLSDNERKEYKQHLKTMRIHIRRESVNIIKCKELNVKRKIVYILIGLKG